MSTQPPRGFAQAQSQAESAARDKNKTKQLLHDALNKAYQNRNQLKSIWEDLMAVVRMLRAWSKGEYQSASLEDDRLIPGHRHLFPEPI